MMPVARVAVRRLAPGGALLGQPVLAAHLDELARQSAPCADPAGESAKGTGPRP
jgi:hypothetical protein